MVKARKINYTYATGKRKSACARVRLFKGKGEDSVNSLAADKYFKGLEDWKVPFKLVGVSDKYFVSVRVAGGGVRSQVEAVAYAIAKALAKENKDKFRKPLKKAGLLTRDSRERERRKVGTGGKARRKKQSPKR